MTVTAPARPERLWGLPATLRVGVALAAIVTIVLVGLAGLFASPASARPLTGPETRVGVFGVAGGQVVGAHPDVLAGQCRARAPNYDRMASGSCVAAESGVQLPETLTLGKNAETGVDVYTGVNDGKDVYVGITNSLERRAAEHAERFALSPMTSEAVTRGEARSIEQAMIERNPGFENIRNSISPSHPWYQQAVDWGEQWLQGNGF